MKTNPKIHAYRFALGLLALTILSIGGIKLFSNRPGVLEKANQIEVPLHEPGFVPLDRPVVSGSEKNNNQANTITSKESHSGYDADQVTDPTQIGLGSEGIQDPSWSQSTLVFNPFNENLDTPNKQELFQPIEDAFTQQLSEKDRQEIEDEFDRPINWQEFDQVRMEIEDLRQYALSDEATPEVRQYFDKMVGDFYELMLIEVEAERALRLKEHENATSIEAQVRQLEPTLVGVAQQLSATQLYQERKRWESAQNPSDAIRLGRN